MKISYLVTCCNETRTLQNLLKRLDEYIPLTDEIFIVRDELNTTAENQKIINDFINHRKRSLVRCFLHPLNNNYGEHKNVATELCVSLCSIKPEYIFQLDGDENPSITLLENLHDIIEANSNVELFYVPRINDYQGVTDEHAKQWGWKLTNSKSDGIAQGRPLVNWCDYQGRIYRNALGRIKWDRALHEKIVGHNEYSFLPAEEEYALYHDKTIEKQLETNIRYNKVFSVEDNMGHKVI